MIDNVLNVSDFGNTTQIAYILDLLEKDDFTIDGLRIACLSYQYDFIYSFEGIILLLEWLKIIRINSNLVSSVRTIESMENTHISSQFFELLFSQLRRDGILNDFLNESNVSYDDKEGLIVIDNNLIDLKFSQFRNMLIDCKFFIPNKLVENQFIIDDNYKELFVTIVIPLIESDNCRKITLEEFKKQQDMQRQIGDDAEEYVLGYEKGRLKGHINTGNIKIISGDNINAGYDIQSYQDIHSIIIDKFIEVKSVLGDEGFYWSKKEIDMSKIKKNRYFLYLIDRDKMSKKDYGPTIIENPYKNVFFNRKGWRRRVEKYYFQPSFNKI